MLAWSRSVPAALIVALALSACGGGGGSSTPRVAPTAGNGNPVPVGGGSGSGPEDKAAYTCSTSDTPSSVAHRGVSTLAQARRAPRPTVRSTTQPSGLLAVTYDHAAAAAAGPAVALREQSAGATLVRSFDYPHVGVTVHVVSVSPQNAARVAAVLRAQPGVRSVGETGQRRFPTSVHAPYYTSDPYFNGFSQTIPVNGGTPPPSTYHVQPYDESAQVPGQWDMHAIGLDYAFEYSQAGNGSGVVNPSALGSAGVKIAIIDTGADTTHPELAGKVAYQKCFITGPDGNQSTSNFTTDQNGHGTDVAGIAAEATNNGLGFAGAGGNTVIADYRVAPTPDDTCAGQSPDDQCSVNSNDITSAINDAIAQHVNVISMSLGGDPCTTQGVDPDPVEGAAVASAIADNIIVVAAAGNDATPGGSHPVDAPACDAGVIAAGAGALADGQPNGDGNSNGSATSPIEYVASYSDSGNPGALVDNPGAWGIIAPGGDPSSTDENPNAPTDDLHWIQNIYTSTPFDSKFAGECVPDYPYNTGPTDCQILIAGTSMSAPIVAGAAALILAVNPAYQSASAMKSLLCTNAHDIGDPRQGCGRLNVYRAMAIALHDPSPPPL